MTDISMTEPLRSVRGDEEYARITLMQRLQRCFFCGRRVKFVMQFIHFLISMFFLLAGIVEFINHPPYFDAYGDAQKNVHILPKMEASFSYLNLIVVS